MKRLIIPLLSLVTVTCSYALDDVAYKHYWKFNPEFQLRHKETWGQAYSRFQNEVKQHEATYQEIKSEAAHEIMGEVTSQINALETDKHKLEAEKFKYQAALEVTQQKMTNLLTETTYKYSAELAKQEEEFKHKITILEHEIVSMQYRSMDLSNQLSSEYLENKLKLETLQENHKHELSLVNNKNIFYISTLAMGLVVIVVCVVLGSIVIWKISLSINPLSAFLGGIGAMLCFNWFWRRRQAVINLLKSFIGQ